MSVVTHNSCQSKQKEYKIESNEKHMHNNEKIMMRDFLQGLLNEKGKLWLHFDGKNYNIICLVSKNEKSRGCTLLNHFGLTNSL